MRLLHYSDKPLQRIFSVEQVGGKADRGTKPNGLWVSVEGADDWAQWCATEEWSTSGMSCVTEVVLAPEHRVLLIEDSAGLWRFHQEYRDVRSEYGYRSEYIKWPLVAEQYQGVIIAPYQWGCRLDGPISDWYYGWDCASGCIWDANAVSALSSAAAKAA